MHEVFLTRLAAHPTLRKDSNFNVFLEFKGEVCTFQCVALTLKTLMSNSNSHLLSVHVFNRSSGENLLKYQLHSSSVIMSLILMTTLFYKALILQGEIWC